MLRKKQVYRIVLIVLVVILVAIVGSVMYYKSVTNNPLKINEDFLEIEIEGGEGFNSLLEKLDDTGALRNKFFLKLDNKINKREINIIEGKYRIEKGSTYISILEYIQSKDASKGEIIVTIPEGYNIEKMANYFSENNIFAKEEFLEAINSYPVPEYIKTDSNRKYNLEGYLYPDTYFFNEGFSADDVINTMLKRFETVILEIESEKGIEISNTDIDTLIIKASLVEKEVREDEERRKVASVIENRLKKNMKLEFCSTINYIIGYEKAVLYNSDLTVDSPYNTYKYYGIPEGPISSPGRSSIEAILNPEKTDYLFFVLTADDKTHHFSTTMEEHENARKEAESKRK